jgi:membrane fusion protein, adhesin transport system
MNPFTIIKETFSYDLENRERFSSQLLFVITAFFVLLLFWMYFAKLDIVVNAQGTVISSARLQVIEHFEGGRVDKIHVRAGQTVKKADVLIELSPLQSQSEYSVSLDNVAALTARLSRLTAEYDGKNVFKIPKKIRDDFPEIVRSERRLLKERQAQYKSQLLQRRSDINSAKARLDAAKTSNAAAIEELNIMRRLVERGLEAEISLVRADKAAAEANSALINARQDLDKAEAAFAGYMQEMQAAVLTELTKVRGELATAVGGSAVMADRAKRTAIRAPIDGVINRVLVSTEGGTVKAGDRVVEMVPSDSSMVIEAKVSPNDIGFVRASQAALVKLTTYDSSVFGALEGKISVVGSDSITEEKGDQYYLVKIELTKTFLEKGDMRLQLRPGMIAQVDIITGKRRIYEYVFSPVTKMLKESFREQ